MTKLVGWATASALMAWLLWQTTASEPLLPHVASGLLLLVVGVLAGLRIAADSAAAYIRDLQRLNKLLADQQRELEEANWRLLQRAASHTAASPERD
jgi:hypothetical protein